MNTRVIIRVYAVEMEPQKYSRHLHNSDNSTVYHSK